MSKISNDFPSEWTQKIDNEVLFSTKNGLSGATICFMINGKVIYKKCHGYQRKYNEKSLMPNPEPMQLDTIFDLASLTKIFSTTLSYMKLVDEKAINIDEKVKHYLPDFSGGDKDDVTIKQLLQHNSGYPPDYFFYNPSDVPSDFYSQTRSKTIGLIPKVPLAYKPGTRTVYSDVNFLALGIILEKVTSMRQDEYVEKNIFSPLGLKNTGYMLQKKGIPQQRFEATERCGNTRDGHVTFPNARTTTIQGEVQDETSYYSMEQVAGHAGLFSTVDDLLILCQLVMNEGQYGQFKLCSPDTVKLFTETLNIDKSYALGFQIPTPETQLIYGLLLPLPNKGKVLAHTGWTGKCFVIDFSNKTVIIILTNKKHSPVLNISQNNYGRFEGDLLPISIYGQVIQLVYGGMVSS